ncbi:MAG: DMT family transporter [Dehalococcoidia bacterium]|nr:DMT family transporter [Dehalococcoidia bacterium]
MVLPSVLFGLAFATGIGVADVISAGLTRTLGVLRTVFLLQAFGVVGMLVFALFTSQLESISANDLLLMAGLTVLVVFFYLGFYKALQLGPIALVGPIVAAHSPVVVVLAVIFLGERISEWQIAAIVAVVFGVVMASVDVPALRSGRKVVGLGVGLAIGVSIAAGFWQFAIAAVSKEMGWFAPVFLTRVFMVCILIPVVVIRREQPWVGLNRKLAAAIIVVAALETLSLLAFTRGSEIGIVSIVAAASTAYPVIPIIGGIVLFKERLSPIQFGGLFVVSLGLLGLTLLP